MYIVTKENKEFSNQNQIKSLKKLGRLFTTGSKRKMTVTRDCFESSNKPVPLIPLIDTYSSGGHRIRLYPFLPAATKLWPR